MGVKTAIVLLVAVLAAGIPAGAGATGLKVTANGGSDDPRLQYPDPRQPKSDPRQQANVVPRPLPVIVITQPVYVAAPSCVVPGHWAYAWVPQSYASSVWVPGYYNEDALWVEAHYESRTYTSGYYQPYWVPDRAC